MDHEPYRVLSHADCIAEIVAMLEPKGGVVRPEYVLPDGRRADVLWLDPQGDVYIFEVKHAYKASLAAMAWQKYFRWCNYLWLAVPALVAADIGRLRVTMLDFPSSAAVGIMGVYPASTAVYHPPREHRLLAEKRALLTCALLYPSTANDFA